MTWERTAERYMTAFDNARQGHWLKVIARTEPAVIAPRGPAAPAMQTGHFLSMCDDTGLFQHAVHSVPDRAHGYCVDDNARALLLACALNEPGEKPLAELLTTRFAAFVQHAWNPDTRRFRNFMGFNRTWLEDQGSEDSHGRSLWALGECARRDASPSRRRWATALFAEALLPAKSFRSPRAAAFTLLGLDAYCAVMPDDRRAQETRRILADGLSAWRADDDAEWRTTATRVFSWFLGSNDLSVALVDTETGSCRDGLHPDRANENRGGESVVCYLLGLAEIRQLARVSVNPANPVALRAICA